MKSPALLADLFLLSVNTQHLFLSGRDLLIVVLLCKYWHDHVTNETLVQLGA